MNEPLRSAFAPVASVDAARAFTRRLALGHYENFPVASLLLPRRYHQDFFNIYAFCRVADDAGDEVGDRQQSLALLAHLREQTRLCYAGETPSTLFAALGPTIRRYDIPAQPFLDLIDAFEQDQRKTRYETFTELRDYCRRSADPVGRLVLYMAGHRDEERQKLSDATCTALQLTNFWQDVQRDLKNLDRIYLPAETMRQFGVTEAQLRSGQVSQGYRDMIRFEVDRAERLFQEGQKLLPLLSRDFRPQISLFGKGGLAVLGEIRRIDYDTLTRRPKLSKGRMARLIAGTLFARLGSRFR